MPTGTYKVVSALNTDRCLHATDTANGGNIDLGSLGEDSNTSFYVNWTGSYYELRVAGTNGFVDVAGAHTGDGTNVQVWEGIGNDYQKWVLEDSGDGQSFYILSRADGYALDVAGGQTTRGANVTTWTKRSGARNQLWRFELVGESQSIATGNYTIVSALDANRCLHATGRSNGDNVDLGSVTDDDHTTFFVKNIGSGYYEIGPADSGRFVDVMGARTCEGTDVQVWEGVGNDYQKWVLRDEGDGWYSILSKGSGFALDVAGSVTSRGTNVSNWTPYGSANQKWRFVPSASKTVSSGDYHIVSALNADRCLHATGTGNGSNIDLGSLSEDANTKFSVTWDSRGYYEISPKGSGRFVDVAGAATGNGVNVQVWEGVGNTYQKWIIAATGTPGVYNILSKASGLALDVRAASTTRGTNVQTWELGSGNNQRWKLVPATDSTSIDIAGATVTLGAKSYVYDGTAKNPGVRSMTLAGSVLKEGEDYQVTTTPAGRTSVGSYTYVITGIGRYSGTKNATFTIMPASITAVAVEGQVFTGDAVTSTPVVKAGALTVPASGYDVAYAHNTSVGTASLTVTGKGNYAGSITTTFEITSSSPASGQQMHRLYNPNSGEHFYTADAGERDGLVRVGWRYEGVGWVAPASGAEVFHLYNPNAGNHHYTTDVGERDFLVSVGWNDEGVGWRTAPSSGVALHRLYNPNAAGAGAHHYTTDASERDGLVRLGWKYEGVGWYGVG